jgi:AcrR family transcriptional regulator
MVTVVCDIAAVNTAPYSLFSMRLGRQEWIDAGLKAMARDGVDAVRIERLAAALNVTKGSFYWHFKDRNALLEELLESWQSRATTAVIDAVEAKGGDARSKLANLFTIVSVIDGQLDRAIRNWAARDGAAASALQEVDRRRLDYLVSLFTGVGFSTAEAVARARLVYHALVGQFTMGEAVAHGDRLTECLNIVLPMLVVRI